MVIHVVYHGFSPTPAVKRRLDAARAEIEKFFRGVVSVEWSIESEGSAAEVACRVHARSAITAPRPSRTTWRRPSARSRIASSPSGAGRRTRSRDGGTPTPDPTSAPHAGTH